MTFDLLTSRSTFAEVPPWSVCAPSLVLIAQVVYLLELGHTHKLGHPPHSTTNATDHPIYMYSSATAGVGNYLRIIIIQIILTPKSHKIVLWQFSLASVSFRPINSRCLGKRLCSTGNQTDFRIVCRMALEIEAKVFDENFALQTGSIIYREHPYRKW